MNSKMQLPNDLWIEQTIKFQERAIRAYIWQTCLNCFNFDKTIEGCKISDNQRPPLNIIVVGCKSHESDIPF